MKDKEFLIQNGVNVEKSLELFGDMETYNDTLKVFIEDIVSKKENLNKYKEIADMANYAIYAHSIKSDARYFGFDHLSELALNHEMAGKQNNMYYVTNNYEEFMKELARIERVCHEYMNIPVVKEEQIITIKDEAILVVDDSPVIKKFIQNIFHDKYQIIEASDGIEAINNLATNPKINKMLLDLNMPNCNGFDVLNYLSQNNLFTKIKAKKYPIKGVLLKPFNERDIKNALEETEIL